MNKKVAILTVLLFGIFLVAGNTATAAVTFDDGGTALQGVLDGITVGPTAGSSSVDVNADQEVYDSLWNLTATGGSVNSLVVELAAFEPNNSFGIYDPTNTANRVQIFGGAAIAGETAMMSIFGDGSVHINGADSGIDFAGNLFGYYLDSSFYSNGGVWHSDTNLNSDSMDHMAAYQGKNIDTVQLTNHFPGLWTDNEFILAFEDLKASVSDKDYTDFVVMIESSNPVPIPGSLLLLGSGMVGLIGFGKRMRKNIF